MLMVEYSDLTLAGRNEEKYPLKYVVVLILIILVENRTGVSLLLMDF